VLINKDLVSFFPFIISVFVPCCKVFTKLLIVLGTLYVSGINILDVSPFLHSMVEDHCTMDFSYFQSDILFAIQPHLLPEVHVCEIQLH
jgi:hypothetical protein